MASTTIPTTKASLLTLLQGVTELTDDNVDIRYAEHPERRRNCVYMGATQLAEIERTAFRGGRARRTEDYTIEVFVEATALNVGAAETKAFEYASAIESALVDDPKLDDSAGLSWAVVSGMESEPIDTTEGSFCRITVEVTCKAQFV